MSRLKGGEASLGPSRWSSRLRSRVTRVPEGPLGSVGPEGQILLQSQGLVTLGDSSTTLPGIRENSFPNSESTSESESRSTSDEESTSESDSESSEDHSASDSESSSYSNTEQQVDSGTTGQSSTSGTTTNTTTTNTLPQQQLSQPSRPFTREGPRAGTGTVVGTTTTSRRPVAPPLLPPKLHRIQKPTICRQIQRSKSKKVSQATSKMSSVSVHPNSKRRTTTMCSTTPPADLASFFECPVCFDYVLPPIFQCQSGHLVCCQCRPKLNCCPTCRGPLGNIRNLAMEKVANTVFFPCKYQTNGCGTVHLHTEKTEHEDICEYRPYVCPCPGASCKWQGSLEQVMPHLMMSHKSITTLQGEDIVFLATDINLPGAVDWVMMQSCFGHHFMLVLEKQDKNDGQHFFAIVQLIGSRKQAEKFAYRLELNGHRRRLTWEATPRSIHEGVASAILNSDCLVFDTSIAQLFAENGNLGINVTISMV